MSQFFGYEDENHARKILGDWQVDRIKANGRHSCKMIGVVGPDPVIGLVMHIYDYGTNRFGWNERKEVIS